MKSESVVDTQLGFPPSPGLGVLDQQSQARASSRLLLLRVNHEEPGKWPPSSASQKQNKGYGKKNRGGGDERKWCRERREYMLTPAKNQVVLARLDKMARDRLATPQDTSQDHDSTGYTMGKQSNDDDGRRAGGGGGGEERARGSDDSETDSEAR